MIVVIVSEDFERTHTSGQSVNYFTLAMNTSLYVPFTPSTLAYRFISESNQRYIQSMFIILLQQQILETKEKFSDTRFGMIYCIHLLNCFGVSSRKNNMKKQVKECYKTVCIVRFQQYFLKVNPNVFKFIFSI